jgi:hypothetical protein
MRKFTVVFLILAVAGLGLSAAGTVDRARQLKSEGRWAEAAQEHPQALCRAVYLLNAAAQAISQPGKDGRDSTGRWLYNNLTADTAKKSDAFLLQATGELANDDGKGCLGADRESALDWLTRLQSVVGPLLSRPLPTFTPSVKK